MSSIQWVDEAWEKSVAKVTENSKRIGATFPHVSKDGKYDAMKASWWTSGFWPGILWLIYQENGDATLRAIAEECEIGLKETLHEFNDLHHDVGFMYSLSSVANYKVTGNPESLRSGLIAANYLAGRFNVKGILSVPGMTGLTRASMEARLDG